MEMCFECCRLFDRREQPGQCEPNLCSECYEVLNPDSHGDAPAKDDPEGVLALAVQRYTKNWYAKYARGYGGVK